MRLFVSVPPPPELIDAIAALPRPELGVRWTQPEQWHVTLRFLGEVDGPDRVVDALVAADLRAAIATVGPHAAMLGRSVVQLPVEGLDDLAEGVVTATAGIGRPPEKRPFRGHLTLARTKGRIDVPRAPAAGAWNVHAIDVVRSHLRRTGARYETVATVPLGLRRV